jgi:hypothetical protein
MVLSVATGGGCGNDGASHRGNALATHDRRARNSLTRARGGPALLLLLLLLLPDAVRSPARSARSEELKHARRVLTQHLVEINRHRIGPEEIVIEGSVGVKPLLGAEAQELVQKVDGILVFNIRPEPLLHASLLVSGDLQLVVQLQALYSWPDLGRDGAAELSDQGQLVLFSVALHYGRSSPHFCHDATRSPQVHSRAIVSLTKEQLGRSVPECDYSVGVSVRLTILVDADGPGKTKIGKLETPLLGN